MARAWTPAAVWGGEEQLAVRSAREEESAHLGARLDVEIRQKV